jgi:hypothetical protein
MSRSERFFLSCTWERLFQVGWASGHITRASLGVIAPALLPAAGRDNQSAAVFMRLLQERHTDCVNKIPWYPLLGHGRIISGEQNVR